MSAGTPLSVDIAATLTLDTVVGSNYRQVSEDDYATMPVTLLDLIVDRAASMLVGAVKADEERYRSLRQKVTERTAELIDERIAPMLDEAIANPIAQTNTYGEPTGKTTTIRELIIDAARKQMQQTNRNNSYGGSSKTALDHALETVTEQAIGKELKAEVDAAKARIRAAVQTVTSDHLGAQLARQLGVS